MYTINKFVAPYTTSKTVTGWLTRAREWAYFIQPQFTHKAVDMQNDPKVTEKRSLRVRNGIEVKCVRLTKVKHLGSTFEIQEAIECFVKARLQALTSPLWISHWTSCRPSDWQVKGVWIWNDQVNRRCTESEPQMKCKCMEWNKNARRVPRECPPRAGCRPKSHFYQNFPWGPPFAEFSKH